jgi:hypothetical protein
VVNPYTPQVGHSVVATLTTKAREAAKGTKLYRTGRIVGPVVEVWDDSCRILTNPGTVAEGDFQLPYKDCNFRFLHLTEEGNQ